VVLISYPQVDIAVDPLDGTSLTATGRDGAIAVIAVAEHGALYDPGPCMYMEKLVVGPEVGGRAPTRRDCVSSWQVASMKSKH
jgi:fructose-1,6-bisphosphatase/sedoheptulose 1,7-bisphosphatase-like protein